MKDIPTNEVFHSDFPKKLDTNDKSYVSLSEPWSDENILLQKWPHGRKRFVVPVYPVSQPRKVTKKWRTTLKIVRNRVSQPRKLTNPRTNEPTDAKLKIKKVQAFTKIKKELSNNLKVKDIPTEEVFHFDFPKKQDTNDKSYVSLVEPGIDQKILLQNWPQFWKRRSVFPVYPVSKPRKLKKKWRTSLKIVKFGYPNQEK
ncbi:hypothetical protein TNCV_880781 [Trichonephila clavipes]|nr:hypothetical protein TNCV_880781 [Trichonephila clavipes]